MDKEKNQIITYFSLTPEECRKQQPNSGKKENLTPNPSSYAANKCVSCGAEWEHRNPMGRMERYCPFCGKELIDLNKYKVSDVVSFLRYVIYTEGAGVLRDVERVLSLFSEYLPEQVVEKRILRTVLESGLYLKIFENKNVLTADDISSYEKYLENDFGISDKWAAESVKWMLDALTPDENAAKNIFPNQTGILKSGSKHAELANKDFNIKSIPPAEIKVMSAERDWVLLKDQTLIIGTDIGNTNRLRNYWKNAKKIIITKNVTNTIPEEFCYLGKLEEVILPPFFREIGFRCFYGCRNLRSVVVQSELEVIGSSAFEGCGNLINIFIPASVKYIGENAFKGTYFLKTHGSFSALQSSLGCSFVNV